MEILLILLVVPISLYLVHDRERAHAWGVVPAGEEVRGTGAYREVRVRTWKRGAPPFSVRAAAFSSFFLGQMIVPGFLAAPVCVVLTAMAIADHCLSPLLLTITLASVTGLFVAGHLFSAGAAMLSRDDGAAVKARAAARWAIGNNVALILALAIGALVEPRHAEYSVQLAVFAVILVAQGLLVRHAASVIEAYGARQADDPAPVEAEIAILGEAR